MLVVVSYLALACAIKPDTPVSEEVLSAVKKGKHLSVRYSSSDNIVTESLTVRHIGSDGFGSSSEDVISWDSVISAKQLTKIYGDKPPGFWESLFEFTQLFSL